ncbi:MAG: hypothetical protein OEP48_06285 [Betaproteobacteria bacterium]|nr:hypothetical protein [Betaproteobacteria bacterium]MDH3437539.1 hypothetical protein [Betaproteobacteria bacterium]
MIEPLYFIFACFTALAALLAAIAIRAPRATPVRAAAIAITAAFIPFAYLGLNEILARPKPMTHEWFNASAKYAMVLGVSLEEGKAIYLWLRVDGSLEPRYYRLPWQQRNAEKLQKAIERAVEEGLGVRVENPFSKPAWTDQGEINIDLVHPPEPPMKHPSPPPQIFNPRERQVRAPAVTSLRG